MTDLVFKERSRGVNYLTDRDFLSGTHRFVASMNTAGGTVAPAWLFIESGPREQPYWPYSEQAWRAMREWHMTSFWHPIVSPYRPPLHLGAPLASHSVPILQTEQRILFVSSDDLDVPWLETTVTAFENLLELGVDERPNPECLAEALTFFGDVLPRDAAPPSVAPLNDGGVQVEWHRGGVDVEVIFSADEDERGIYVREKGTGEEQELPLTREAFSSIGSRLSVTI